jgi:putative Holliday junction resolvase
VRIGIDVGEVRVGVAASDADGWLAVPVATLARDHRTMRDMDEVVALVRARGAVEVLVGLPRSLSGREGPAAALARRYATTLATRTVPVPVRLVDERFTTVTANRRLAEGGVSGRRRRAVIDQEAAVQILQADLDAHTGAGRTDGAGR